MSHANVICSQPECQTTAGCKCNTPRDVSAAALRLRRIERDVRWLEDELREQAAGSQDGYLLGVADRLRRILA